MSASAFADESSDRHEARRARSALIADIGAALAGLGREPALTTWRLCPACGADSPTRRPVLGGTVYDYHRCDNCTLIYTPRVLHDDIVRARYRDAGLGRAYRRLLRAESESIDPECHARVLDRVLDFAPTRGTAIDVGCGFGALTAALTPRFDEALGLELDGVTAETAERRHGISVRTARLEDLGREEESVDAITFHEVLEELPDLGGVLRAARRLLRSEGVVYIGATNGASVGIGLLGAHHPAVATHLQVNLFTPAALEALATRYGFEVRSLATNDDLDVSVTDWALSRLPDAAVGLGSALDRVARAASQKWHLASRRLRGSTLELVATKTPSC
jgi:2-polyprenyl-3-methyl-5-hydroxy-6-metoxy-1,4-benzoquinol methylase